MTKEGVQWWRPDWRSVALVALAATLTVVLWWRRAWARYDAAEAVMAAAMEKRLEAEW